MLLRRHLLRAPLDGELPVDTVADTTEAPADLRDTYAGALSKAMESDGAAAGGDTPSADTAAAPATGETASEAAARARDDKGRFAASEKTDAKPAADPAAAPVADQQAAPAFQPPKSWKAEHHETFKTLAPKAQEYILQREKEVQEGFAKHDAEVQARYAPLTAAIEPHLPYMQQAGVTPDVAVKNSLEVYKQLVFGDANQRLQTLLDLAHHHNVPLSDYIAQGGRLPQFNPNRPHMQAPAQQQPQVADVQTLVRQELEAHQHQQSIKQFTEAKDAQGNPLHPHYEALKPAMIGLLQSGLATDLDSAYAKALRMDDNLSAQHQQSQAAAAAAQKAADAKAAAERAKKKDVSVTDSSRSAHMTTNVNADLRDTYAAGLQGARV